MAAKKQLMLKNVVLAFPNIAEPQAFGKGEPAYGAKFPIVPNSEQHKLIEAAMLEVAKEEWGDKNKTSGEPYQGFEGKHYLSTRNAKTQPSVYNAYGDDVVGKADIEREAFSGAVVNASIEIWAQDSKDWGRRINCSLRGIMLTGEGENFGGGSTPASANEFAAFAKAKADAEDIL